MKNAGLLLQSRHRVPPQPPRRGHIRYPGLFLGNINSLETAFSGYERPFCATLSHLGPEMPPDMACFWPLRPLFLVCIKITFLY